MDWFISIKEEITGPFSTDMVLSISEDISFNSSDAYVWGARIDEWLNFEDWLESHQNILSNSSKPKAKNLIWYYAENSQSSPIGPFDRTTLVSKIAEVEDRDQILVWSKGMDAWASLFEFSDILESLNISRRKHPRAPIDGQVILKSEDGQAHIGKIEIISPGGCGVTNIPSLVLGELYQIEIKSPALYNSITAVGKILHQSDINTFGIRFEKIHIESQSTIISYLKEQGYIKKANAA